MGELLAAARGAAARAARVAAERGEDPTAALEQLRQAQWLALERAAPGLVAGGGSPMLPALAAWRLLTDRPWRCPRSRWEQGEQLCRAWDRLCGRPGAGAVELMWEVVDHLSPQDADGERGHERHRMLGARRVGDGRRVGGDTEGPPRSLAYFVVLLKRRVRTAKGRKAGPGARC